MAYLKQLATLEKGTSLYKVKGWTAPEQAGGKLVEIGNLVLED
jgi:hypothetical protein